LVVTTCVLHRHRGRQCQYPVTSQPAERLYQPAPHSSSSTSSRIDLTAARPLVWYQGAFRYSTARRNHYRQRNRARLSKPYPSLSPCLHESSLKGPLNNVASPLVGDEDPRKSHQPGVELHLPGRIRFLQQTDRFANRCHTNAFVSFSCMPYRISLAPFNRAHDLRQEQSSHITFVLSMPPGGPSLQLCGSRILVPDSNP